MVDVISSEDFGREEFNREYYKVVEKEPILVKNEVADWDATRKWTPEYLDSMLGNQEVTVSILDEDILTLNHPEKVEYKSVPFPEARKLICENGNFYLAQATVKYPVSTRILVGKNGEFTRLAGDITEPRFLDDFTKQCYVTNLWFGGDKCKTPLHFDDKDNFFIQIFGEKRILLFSPTQTEFLYQAHGEEHDHLSRVNVFDPDESEFPLFAEAEWSEVVVEPGDLLYIPEEWWHAVETLTTSISLNFWWTSLTRHIREVSSQVSKRVFPFPSNEKN